MNIESYIISKNTKIIDAMKTIDKNEKGIVFICDTNNKLLGTLTDGDIRRFIISGGNLSELAIKVMNKNPQLLHQMGEKQSGQIMEEYKITAIPLVDNNGCITEIIFSDDNAKSKLQKISLPVVIMAGGKGTRLKPYTNILPKPLIPVGDRTISEHIIKAFSYAGCKNFYMILNYKKNFIESYFKESEEQFNISFVHEDVFRGTGGGLSLLKGVVNETFFMTNCDIIIDEDYKKIVDFHKANNNIATMVCAIKQQRLNYGTVDVQDGYVVNINEKPVQNIITNTGLYILEPELLTMIPKEGEVPMTDFLQSIIDKGHKVGMYPVNEDQWFDMGELEELERMKKHLNVE